MGPWRWPKAPGCTCERRDGRQPRDPGLSSDGSLLTHSTWDEPGAGYGALIDVLEIDAGVDRTITPDTADRSWQAPQFMPDGEAVLDSLQDQDLGTFRFALIPAAGGPDRPIGPGVADMSPARWKSPIVSPDGASVLATSMGERVEDGRIWSIDVASGIWTELPWAAPVYLSWQRVAP